MSLPLTALYAGVNVVFTAFLGFQVVRKRWATRTSIGDGGHKEMTKAQRAHGNNVENVPLALSVIGLLEGLAAPIPLVHGLGICLTLGRLAHARGLYQTLGPSKLRIAGMILTWLVFWVGGPVCLYYGIRTL